MTGHAVPCAATGYGDGGHEEIDIAVRLLRQSLDLQSEAVHYGLTAGTIPPGAGTPDARQAPPDPAWVVWLHEEVEAAALLASCTARRAARTDTPWRAGARGAENPVMAEAAGERLRRELLTRYESMGRLLGNAAAWDRHRGNGPDPDLAALIIHCRQRVGELTVKDCDCAASVQGPPPPSHEEALSGALN